MCGRFSLSFSRQEILAYFDVAQAPEVPARYNIAPSMAIAAVRNLQGRRQLDLLSWGLIPFWADDAAIGARMINARAETAHQKPSFRAAFRSRRCLIPADGFYEWKKQGSKKQPYFVRMREDRPMAFAGLWERWQNPQDPNEVIESCTILTTAANELLSPIHDRMPVIIAAKNFELWLDPGIKDPARISNLLVPFDPAELRFYPVSDYVNKAGQEGARCVEPLA